MWIKIIVLCAAFALAIAAAEDKKKDDSRGKRNLEYSISHTYPQPNYRSDRRISNIPPSRYSHYFPGRPYTYFRKGGPNTSKSHVLPPPYAVQMEPLVHYSQRDPLYDPSSLHPLTPPHNELTKGDDLVTDNNHLSENLYGHPKQYIERPVYIKEPEPIIEIIIKEANTTQPPPQLVTPPPKKKKEEVQVFYVKYKKNPHGSGKDSVIYEKPIPAISPVQGEAVHDESHQYSAPQAPVTYAPPTTTTIRAIIKPDSETYHADGGIHITFGGPKHNQNAEKFSHDDDVVESAPHPALISPQGRRFPDVNKDTFHTVTQEYRPQQRLPQPYKPFNFNQQPISSASFSQHQSFSRPISQPPPSSPSQQQFQFPQTSNFPSRPPSPQFQQSFSPPKHYQSFEQIQRPQQGPPFQFPKSQTHFPVHQPPTGFSQNLQRPPTRHQVNQVRQQPSQQQVYHSRPVQLPQQPQQFSPLQQPQVQFQQHQQQLQIHQQPIQPQAQAHQHQQQIQSQIQHHQQPQVQQIHHQQQQIQLQQQQIQNHQIHQQQQLPHHQQFAFNGHSQQFSFGNSQQLPSQAALTNLQQNQHIIPPGGELIQSVPKYEQHISIPASTPAPDHLSPDEFKHQVQQQFSSNEQLFTQHQSFGQTIQERHPAQSQRPIQSSFNYQTTPRTTTASKYYFNTTPSTTTTTTTTTTPKPESTTTDLKELNIQLPDEVPDDLREQLLSSGILKNAQISVLDYDKVGDIPISALPPEHLANFYKAGGAQQVASASNVVQKVVKTDGTPVDQETAGSETDEVKVKAPVEMKVVHYDPQTDEGKQVREAYVKEGATQVEPVVLNDQTYNKYLPLKVSGAQFPIPDVEALKGKNINSVVVLAPVDYNFTAPHRVARQTQKIEDELKHVRNGAIKDLLQHPTAENYRRFLENENMTSSEKQSVILLVTGSENNREIFMYDVATQTVSKLDGELSAAFVDAAESNSPYKNLEQSSAETNLIETKVPLPEGVSIDTNHHESDDIELDSAASEFIHSKVPVIDPMQGDLDAEGSEQLESFVDVSGLNLHPQDDLALAASDDNHVLISSSYSKTDQNMPSST